MSTYRRAARSAPTAEHHWLVLLTDRSATRMNHGKTQETESVVWTGSESAGVWAGSGPAPGWHFPPQGRA